MAGKLTEIFIDKNLVEKIKRRLPYLFQLAELESSRAGKTGKPQRAKCQKKKWFCIDEEKI